MSLLTEWGQGRAGFVLHPTDLSHASERAFHHALAFALRGGARFTLLHAVGRRTTDNWADFPSVRTKVAQWRAAGAMQGVEGRVRQASISKVEVPVGDPVAACLQYLERHSVDLIVVATEGRSGLSRLLRAPRAERLASRSGLMTLFVPEGGRYFVDAASGAISLRRILVPVDPLTDPRPAMLRAVQAATLMDDPTVEITLLHVADGEEADETDVPALPFCRWNIVRRSGDVVAGILETAEQSAADAIYMSTAWSRPGLVRAEGGVTEAVLAAAPCPIATVPVVRERSNGGGQG